MGCSSVTDFSEYMSIFLKYWHSRAILAFLSKRNPDSFIIYCYVMIDSSGDACMHTFPFGCGGGESVMNIFPVKGPVVTD